MKEKLYEQVGINYRFFLSWRHTAFAGYVVMLGAIVSFSIVAYKDAKPLLWLVPLAGVPFGLFFWVIDIRIQKIFQCAIQAGRKLEGELGGYFTEQATIGSMPKQDKYPRVTHTAALRIIYVGATFALAALSLYFKFQIT